MTVSTDPGAAADAAAPHDPARRPRGPVWAVLALVLGVALGIGIGLSIPHFTKPGDDSVEAGFLRDMSTHHAQAVEMSMIAHQRSDDPEIVYVANDIALTQHGQIGYMQAWLRDWGLSPSSTRQPMEWMPNSAGSIVNGLMPGMATPEQLTKLRGASGKELNTEFLTLMRQHHLGGIHMAQEAVKLSDNKDIDWIAQSMVNSQQSELGLIDDLLKKVQAG
ncbi:DUF305 domain-containing protein [Paractinoplanes brasiliensis]|uniref:Uncharacterized protein (DUF305 family) n=1 Tax=Paractinoplanes brasiliensis TaxID=52695 RepID=A0A4R6JV48_9ACTN|nr:DUF305 domain-containing protein [Actinoplanes brasiliensis]TDO40479.1 uncharacterized protein (DUF305 family) [Actinoplanes brasiliensis]GID25547.1 DUF305 domain-containing protein [Actinoplanes brasiliensis]